MSILTRIDGRFERLVGADQSERFFDPITRDNSNGECSDEFLANMS
jgi:hypothetical protein